MARPACPAPMTTVVTTLERVPVMSSHIPRESWPGLSRPSTSCLLSRRKKDVDAREDGVPAALRGGESLRGHNGGAKDWSVGSIHDHCDVRRIRHDIIH